MSNAVLRSAYRVEASVRTVYTGNGVAVPEDGQLIISAARDCVVVMEYDTGAVLCTASTGDGETISHICCSDDGKWVFTASRSLQGCLWRVVTDEFFEVSLKRERTWVPSKHPVSSSAFTPSNSSLDALWLATACTDGAVRLWDPMTNGETHTLHNDGGIVLNVSFVTVAKRTFMVAGCMSGMVAVWDVQTRDRVLALRDHSGAVEAVEFFYSGAMMVTCGRDGILNIYRLSVTETEPGSGKKRKRSGGVGFEATQSHTFTVLEEVATMARMTKSMLGAQYGAVVDDADQDKEVIVVGGAAGKVRYFYLERNGRGRKCKKAFGASDSITEADVGPNQKLSRVVKIVAVKPRGELLVATADHDLDFFSPTLERKRLIVGKIDQVVDSKYGHDDQIIAASNSAAVRVFHTTNPFCEILVGHEDVVLTLSVSRCRRYLASGSKDRTVKIWDTKAMTCLATLKGHTGDVTSLCFGNPPEASSSPPTLISASADLSLKLWDLRDVMGGEKRFAKLQQQQGLTPECPVVLESSPNTTTPMAHEADISCVSMSPTAEMAASCSKDKTVRIWAVKGGKSLQMTASLKGHRKRVHCVAFSTHERRVASGSGDATVKLWSLNQGEGCQKTFQGHETPVLSVAFINNGLQLLSASSDGVVKVWGIKSHANLATLAKHTDRVWSIDVDRDERRFITSGSDGVINVWRDYSDDDYREKEMQKALSVKQSQLLSDKMRKKEYDAALELCLRLNHPRDMKDALVMLLREGTAEAHMKTVIAKVGEDMLTRLVTFIKRWMLNALTADIAAVCLRALLGSVHVTGLAENEEVRKGLEPLLSYGTRHHDRLRLHLQQLHLISMFTGQQPSIPQLASS